MRPVAVTAVGVVSGLGLGLHRHAQALLRGDCGGRAVDGLPAAWVVAAPNVPEAPGFPDDRKVDLLWAAATAVLNDCDVPPERRAVFLGTGLSSVTPRELEEDVYPNVVDGRVDRAACMRDLAADRVAPRRHLPARATAALAARFAATGPTGTTFSACAASAEAIAAAARAIARGDADVALAGGHDSMLHPLGMLSFRVLGALATGAGRPFDRDRDGFVLGEGAAVLRLEAAERATSPLGWILGAGSSVDAHGITAPHPDGLGAEAAMRRALHDAGLEPAAIDWVNAHATATPVGDAAEARAVGRVLGDRVPVTSIKGALGHTLAAAGAIEAAVTLAAFGVGVVPGTVGCVEPDDLGIRIQRHSAPLRARYVLSNSFGFGGQNTSLVIGAPEVVA